MKKWLPWIFVAIFAGWVLSTLRPEPQPTFDYRAFARLPVMSEGRIQPMDTVARNTLLQIRNRQSVFLEDESRRGGLFPAGTNLTALQWLMDVTMKPEVANDQKVFRIDNQELIGQFGLPAKDKYFSFNQLKENLMKIGEEARRIEELKVPVQNQTPYDRQVSKLANALMTYERLAISLRPPDPDDVTREWQTAAKDIKTIRASSVPGKDLDAQNQATLKRLEHTLSNLEYMSNMSYVLPVPPERSDMPRDHWASLGGVVFESLTHNETVDPVGLHYAAIVTAYRQNKPAEFNQAVADYSNWLGQWFAPEAAKGRSEFFYNHFQAFYLAMIIYITAFVLAFFYWVKWEQWLRVSALYLISLAFILHTFGLIHRIVLQALPPVTNLYSSAIFIGWGAVILGVVLERLYRDGIGAVIAATAGFLTLIIAHNLALAGDTMEMLVAVLKTNFWLSTHVTIVTLGYASTYVAGFLAIIYVIRGMFTRSLDSTTVKSLTRMVYGIVCFAALFSFVGTVLGGIWADQSWGRFWGWDPKENGALLIVIWNATILHARWGGMIKERGLMNMALFGNIVTSWSWFGVNMLGIGLHSYGFTDDAKFWWLLGFVISQLALIGLGLLPKHYWRSFREAAPVRSPGKGRPVPAAA